MARKSSDRQCANISFQVLYPYSRNVGVNSGSAYGRLTESLDAAVDWRHPLYERHGSVSAICRRKFMRLAGIQEGAA